jgi:hypothetical protein
MKSEYLHGVAGWPEEWIKTAEDFVETIYETRYKHHDQESGDQHPQSVSPENDVVSANPSAVSIAPILN